MPKPGKMKRGLWQPREIQWQNRKSNETAWITWLGRALTGSLWLCCSGLWLGDRKVGSQVVGKNQSQFTGRRTVEKLVDEEKEPANQRTSEHTDLGSDLGERERQACGLPCFNLGFGKDKRDISQNRDVSQMIFITSMSGSISLTCFTYCIFHFRRLPGLKMAFDAAKRNGKFGRIQCQRSRERVAAEERERDEYFSAERQ